MDFSESQHFSTHRSLSQNPNSNLDLPSLRFFCASKKPPSDFLKASLLTLDIRDIYKIFSDVITR